MSRTILDRVDYAPGYVKGLAVVSMLGVECVGMKQNGSGMTCLAVRSEGKARAKLIEVGFVQRIEMQGRTFVAPPYENWSKRAAELEAFLGGAPAPLLSTATNTPEPNSSASRRPWWRRLLG